MGSGPNQKLSVSRTGTSQPILAARREVGHQLTQPVQGLGSARGAERLGDVAGGQSAGGPHREGDLRRRWKSSLPKNQVAE
jgi:hypothetical protein